MTNDSLPFIDVERLQLGMYVVLELGWQNHPFAFNSFTLRTPEQIDQLRSLGLARVRYSPERSTAQPLSVEEAAQARQARQAAAEQPVAAEVAPKRVVEVVERPLPVAGEESPLQQQEAALRRVEAEFRQATQRHQLLLKHLLFEPHKARQIAEELAETLYESVAHSRPVALRLLSQRLGDRPSGHDIGVSALAMMLARDCGFSAGEMREIALAAVMHDIGKVKIPAFLHEDHGQLTEFERKTYRQHVEFGVDQAGSLGLSRAVIRAIGEHHERYDGSGFPAGLRGDQLSSAGRLLAIVNRYQNLVAPLHLEAGMTPHQALQHLYGVERAHFDPVFLPRFVRVMGVYPPGSLVELTDHRMAIVISSRPGLSLAPKVQIVDTPGSVEPSLAFDLDPGQGLGVRGSVRLDELNSRWAMRARQLARSALFIEPVTPPAQVA